jgi:hypothetical protein
MRRAASRVAAPRCGVGTKVGRSSSGLPTGGSRSKASAAAPGEVAAAQRVRQRGLVDQAAARGVDEHGAGLEAREDAGVDQVAGVGVQADVEADGVGGGPQRVEVDAFDAGHVGAYGSWAIDAHAERGRAAATARPMRPRPTRPSVLPSSSQPAVRVQAPARRSPPRSAGRGRARAAAPGELGDRRRVGAGGVGDGDAVARGGVEVDGVDAGAEARHHAQARRRREDARVAAVEAEQQRVGVGRQGRQLGGRPRARRRRRAPAPCRRRGGSPGGGRRARRRRARSPPPGGAPRRRVTPRPFGGGPRRPRAAPARRRPRAAPRSRRSAGSVRGAPLGVRARRAEFVEALGGRGDVVDQARPPCRRAARSRARRPLGASQRPVGGAEHVGLDAPHSAERAPPPTARTSSGPRSGCSRRTARR